MIDPLQHVKVIGLAIVAASVISGTQAAGAASGTSSRCSTRNRNPGDGCVLMLERLEDGVATRPAPARWLATPTPCGTTSVTDDGSFNAVQIDAARISVVWGDAGPVSNPGDRLNLYGGLENVHPATPASRCARRVRKNIAR